MVKCLVTKLNSIVENKELTKLGELKIKINKSLTSSKNIQSFNFKSENSLVLKIEGDGYFTNEELSVNKGKELTIPANTDYNIYVSNGNYDISIISKYSLLKFSLYASDVSISSLKHNASFDLSSLRYSNKITIINLTNGDKITGSLSDFASMTELKELQVENCSLLNGNINDLSKLKKIRFLKTFGTNISGNISSLLQNDSLSSAFLSNVSGSIDTLQNHESLTKIDFRDCNVNGDLAKVPSKLVFVGISNKETTHVSWSNRPNSDSAVSIMLVNTIVDNVDKMLEDLSHCSDVEYEFKKIVVTGNRTSASDAAVQTLQNKGYTVSITPA